MTHRETILDMWATGARTGTISAALNVGPHIVQYAIETGRLRGDARAIEHKGGATSTWTPALVDRLKALWEAGHTCSDIAERLGNGVTRNAVIGKVNRLKLPERGRNRIVHKPTGQRRVGSGQIRAIQQARAGVAYSKPIVVRFTPAAAPTPRKHPLVDLEPADCRWPLGDTNGPHTLFCGVQKDGDAPYCAYHCQRSYVPGSSQAERDARKRERVSMRGFL